MTIEPEERVARERAYIEGAKMQLRKLLQLALSELCGFDAEVDTETRLARLVLERDEAVAALRDACEDHGDNDWARDLCLADIIKRHLVEHLDG